MGDVVNLRRARKARSRADRAAEAERNRATFGRGRAEREQADAAREGDMRRLDAHRLEPGDAGG